MKDRERDQQFTKHEIVKAARALCDLMATPKHAQHLLTFTSLDVLEFHGKYPTALWVFLAGAISPAFERDAEKKVEDWAALVKIIALAHAAQLIPNASSQSLGSVLRMAGVNRIRLLSLIGVPTREDFRLLLVRCVSELTKARIAFPIDEVAELLLLDGADREQTHKKLAGDCAI